MQRRLPLVAHAGLALALLVAAAEPSRAQAPSAPGGAADSARAAQLARLRPGAWVRVATVSRAERMGEVRRASADSLLLARVPGARGGTLALAAVDVRTLWVWEAYTRADVGTGAAIGGAVGGVLGVLAGGFMCESGCGQTRAAGTLMGAAAGALVGATVATLVPRWQRLVP